MDVSACKTTSFYFFGWRNIKHDVHAVMLMGWKHEWPTLLSSCPGYNPKGLLVWAANAKTKSILIVWIYQWWTKLMPLYSPFYIFLKIILVLQWLEIANANV